MPAEVVVGAVREHADRIHDLVRRLGCGPQSCAGVVEASATDLVAWAAGGTGAPAGAGDRARVALLVGHWAAFAAGRAQQVCVGGIEPTVGGGLLSRDAEQELLAIALAGRDERDRCALLLRDAYDLPAAAVGVALGLDPSAALRLVGAARLRLLPDVFAGDEPLPAVHGVDETALARLAEGEPAHADAAAARHLRGCAPCAEVVRAQHDVRRLLAGLSVVALDDADRDALLERVAGRARATLPGGGWVAPEVDQDEPRRLLSPGPVLLGLLLALAAGAGLGALLSRPSPVQAAQVGPLTPVTAPPVTPLPAPATARPGPAASPTTTVFTYPPTTPASTAPTPPPRTTPPPTSASPTPPAAAPSVTVSPSTGQAGSALVVTGAGWPPADTVVVALFDQFGRPTGSAPAATTTAAGTFRLTLTAGPADAQPGAYRVQAGDGTRSARTTFTVV